MDFQQHIQRFVRNEAMRLAARERLDQEAKLQAATQERKAQEEVLGGAHNGQTLTAIAERTVAKKFGLMQQQLQKLQRQQPQSATRPSSKPQVQHRSTGKKHRRDDVDDDADVEVSTDLPGISVEAGTRHVSFRDHSSHATNSHHRRHSPAPSFMITARQQQRPKNGEGGDRQHRQHKKQNRRDGNPQGKGGK
jgi:hypothetical protein